MRDAILSLNEREFIVKALLEEQRVDGRRPFDSRPPKFEVHADGTCELQLGATRALAVVSAELTPPFRDRPSEGIFSVNVELGPMASPQFETGRPSDAAVELTRMLERGLKQSGAVDTESLVVQAGRWVWTVRVDVHVLDHGGNLAGAASIAALAALLTFRRPEVTISPETGALEEHPPELREPLPLSLHHLPCTLSFAFFDGAGDLVVLDPSFVEEETALGVMTVTMNSQGDVCGVQKAGGVAISAAQLLRCMRIAAGQATKLTDALRGVVRAHNATRLAGRVRRHKPGDAALASAGFELGAKLDSEAEAPPEYLACAGDDEGDDEPPANDEVDWDHAEPAVSFPFAGPLCPVGTAAAVNADGDISMPAASSPRTAAASAVQEEQAAEGDPVSLLAAVKPAHRKRK